MTTEPAWQRIYMSARDLDQFEDEVIKAKSLGATHIDVGRLPSKPRHEKTDPTDPYLEYSFILPCLFRLVVPEQLRCMTPVAYEKQSFTLLKTHCDILAKHGLKGRLWMLEPHAVPDAVFEKYPHWRGPRVDFPPRVKKPYFSLCIDQPEVLDLYRQTVRRLLEQCPVIDTFRITTNDSGAGVCWSAKLYSGTNGPVSCMSRPFGQRMRGFFNAFLDAGKDLGLDVQVLCTPRGFSSEQAEAARHAQPPNAEVLPDPSGRPNEHAGAGGPPGTIGISNPLVFLRQLGKAARATELHVGFSSEIDRTIYIRFRESPALTRAQQASFIEMIAAELVGDAEADKLVEAWHLVQEGFAGAAAYPFRNLIFEHGVISKRWLTRPFVCFPEQLAAEERTFWQPYMWDAGDPEEFTNMLNVQATIVCEGTPQGYYLRLASHSDGAKLDAAAAIMESFDNETLRDQALRLQAAACLYRNVGNTALFQTYLTRGLDPDVIGTDWSAFFASAGPVRKVLPQILREEIDNTHRLADLLDSSDKPLLRVAKTADEEDCFTLPPNLSQVLRKKAKVMNDHLIDCDRLFHYPRK